MRLLCFFLTFFLAQPVQVQAQGGFSLPNTVMRPVAPVPQTQTVVKEPEKEASFVKPVSVKPAVPPKTENGPAPVVEKNENTGFKLTVAKVSSSVVQNTAKTAASSKTSASVKKVQANKKPKVRVADVDEDLSPAEKWLSVKGQLLLEMLALSSSTKKRDALTGLAGEVFRQRELARLAIGRYWGELSPEQQEEYVSLFVPYFVSAYGAIPFPVDGVSFRMGGVTPSGKDLLVKTEVDLGDGAQAAYEAAMREDETFQKPEGTTMEIYFALRNKDGGFYIRDVNVMGKSMVMILRGMLEKMYKNAQTNPDEFIQAMRSKIEHEDKRLQLLEQFGDKSKS